MLKWAIVIASILLTLTSANNELEWPKIYITSDGKKISSYCPVTVVPKISYELHLDGEIYEIENNGDLKIKNGTSDRNHFGCFGSYKNGLIGTVLNNKNTAGNIDCQMISAVIEEETARFVCKATTKDPNPEIEWNWLYRNKPISESKLLYNETNNKINTTTIGQLNLNLTIGVYGSIGCSARSGNDKDTAMVTVTIQPQKEKNDNMGKITRTTSDPNTSPSPSTTISTSPISSPSTTTTSISPSTNASASTRTTDDIDSTDNEINSTSASTTIWAIVAIVGGVLLLGILLFSIYKGVIIIKYNVFRQTSSI